MLRLSEVVVGTGLTDLDTSLVPKLLGTNLPVVGCLETNLTQKSVGLPLHIVISIITRLYTPLGGLIKSAIRAVRCLTVEVGY